MPTYAADGSGDLDGSSAVKPNREGEVFRSPADVKRIAWLKERLAFVELQACAAILWLDRGDVAEARAELVEATKDMLSEEEVWAPE